jgi:hypothetical protein
MTFLSLFFVLSTVTALSYPIRNAFDALAPLVVVVSERSQASGEWRELTRLSVRYGDWSSDGTVSVTVNASVPVRGQTTELRFAASQASQALLEADTGSSTVGTVDLVAMRVPEWNAKRFLLTEAARERPAAHGSERTAHWKSKISVSLLDDFDVHASSAALTPAARYYYEHWSRQVDGAPDRFLPILFVHDMYNFGDDFVPLDGVAAPTLPVTITYAPQTLLRYQWMIDLSSAFMKGDNPLIAKEDGEDMRRMFLDTHPYLLYATSLVSLLHIVFDILAFKNDISFWRQRKSFEGLSLRYLFASTLSQIVVFLYLADQRSSKLVIVPAAISAVVELWKVTRAFTVSLAPLPEEGSAEPRKSFWQRLQLRERHARRAETAEIDAQAWRTLGPILAAILVVYAAYTLVFVKQVGWYGWALGAMVGFVYGSGFIMMTPQLYLNHRLKSVAHLPWRVFVYKAMNTFIDDLFAFVIKMPTMHRIACFRDDLIFCVFLYQRYIYPTDLSRVNEYGQTGEEATKDAAADASAAKEPAAEREKVD